MSDDARYIIMPGDMRKDDRLTLAHYKVAMVLGAYSKRYGWTDLTQNDVGEMAGLSRETVCRCVGDLADWGWVARRKKDGRNQYVYRFIMDREDCEPAVTVPKKDCEPAVTDTVISGFTSKEKSSTNRQSTCPLPHKPGATSASGQKDISDSKGSGEPAATSVPARNVSASGNGRKVATEPESAASLCVPSIRIARGEVCWERWLDRVRETMGDDAVTAMTEAGEIWAAARWPRPGIPPPRIGRR